MFGWAAPIRDHASDYAACIRFRRGASTKAALLRLDTAVTGARGSYLAHKGDPAKIVPVAMSANDASILRKNFSLLGKGRSLHLYRQELIAALGRDKCPFCGRGNVSALDHYLPIAHFPEFSTFALNLIPACYECNSAKGQTFRATMGDRFLHAYFDHLPDEEGLIADVTIHSTVQVSFRVVKTPSMSKLVHQILNFHFDQLELDKHFRREANQELSDRREAISTIYDAKGAVGVSSYLEGELASAVRSMGRYYWKSALLSGLARSAAFCAGGFAVLS